MIFPILLIFIPRVLSMNPISAFGHSVLSKKYGINKPESAAAIRAPALSYASPPEKAIAKHPEPCSPFPSCANSPERVANAIFSDTPISIDAESPEEHQDSTSVPVIDPEECLREKANIDRVRIERAKLGPFLIESTERPVIDNITALKESVEAIRAKIKRVTKNHFYDDIDTLKQEYRCYGLNHIDIIAIRLYTTSISFIVNEALRKYSLHDTPIPTDFLPYIYALINGLAKFYRDRETYEACGPEPQPFKVVRYISWLDPEERVSVQPIIDAHQPGVYIMYPAFTSSTVNDLGKGFWPYGFECRFEIQTRTAIAIDGLSINQNEFEAVFLPGTIFHVLERDGPYITMEEITLEKLDVRQAQIQC